MGIRAEDFLLNSPLESIMLSMLRNLVDHKWYANSSLLTAIGQHQPAAHDEELRKLLHHILLANKFWLALSMEQAFSLEKESNVPESLAIIAGNYRETHATESKWIAQIQEADLARALQTPYISGASFSVAEGLMQVCMHSHGHRAQCATRLRLLGGKPPASDFILWLKERKAPEWL